MRTHAKEVLLAGPKLHATEAEMDQWLSSYRDALDEVTADEENPGNPPQTLSWGVILPCGMDDAQQSSVNCLISSAILTAVSAHQVAVHLMLCLISQRDCRSCLAVWRLCEAARAHWLPL